MYRGAMYWQHWRIGIVALLAIAIFVILYRRKPRTVAFQFSSLLSSSYTDRGYYWLRMVALLGLFVSVSILVMRPQAIKKTTIHNEGIDIVVALDVSYSMEATDFLPNRMSAAREVLTQFASQIETDRMGVVVFAGKPFVSVPLTFDYGIVSTILQQTSTNNINQNVPGLQGTAIGDALLSSLTLLEKGREDIQDGATREQVIILLTDGEANTGVDPSVVAQLAAAQQIKIYTVGIGSLAGGIIQFDSAFGTRSQQIPGVDEETLRGIAQDTGGKYRRATDQKTFQRIFDELTMLEKTTIEQEQSLGGRDIWTWLLWVSVVCLMVLFMSDLFVGRVDKNVVDRFLLIAMSVCIVIAIWNPGPRSDTPAKTGGATMVMLDVSTSMYVQDIVASAVGGYVSRIDAAKALIERFVTEHAGGAFGLGVFGGEAFGVVPITSDEQTLLSLLGGLDAGVITKQGTNVQESLSVGIDRFASAGSFEDKQLIIITDGGDEDIEIAAHHRQRLRDESISLSVVAIGSEQGGPIYLGRDKFGHAQYKQYDGEMVISTVNVTGLRSFARDLDGGFLAIDTLDNASLLSDSAGGGARHAMQSGIIKRLALRLVRCLSLWYMVSQTVWGSKVFPSRFLERYLTAHE